MIGDIIVVALIGFFLALLAISPYVEYKERIEKIKENYTYAYGTYKDFLREFNKVDFKYKPEEDFKEAKFYYYGKNYEIYYCMEKGDICFNDVYMILSFKDYIKYKMFFRKMSRKAVKEENEEIKLMKQRAIKENRIEKWNK